MVVSFRIGIQRILCYGSMENVRLWELGLDLFLMLPTLIAGSGKSILWFAISILTSHYMATYHS